MDRPDQLYFKKNQNMRKKTLTAGSYAIFSFFKQEEFCRNDKEYLAAGWRLEEKMVFFVEYQ